jgi:hypothetical protein
MWDDGLMDLPDPIAEMLGHDRALADQHEVRFSVVSRPTGSGPESGLPDNHGAFDDPADAVALGRSLTGRNATVLADGRGAYWHTSAPDEINSELLRIVCRDKRLGPQEAEREHQREHWHHAIERLEADRRLAEAVDVIRACQDADEAERHLQGAPYRFTRPQVRHLLGNRRLELLTRQGRRRLHAELEEAVKALDDLGPPPDDTR